MRRHRRDLAPIAQINLTSLLDVTFVLLIAFIIVAPTLKYGVEVDLPTLREGAPPLEQDQANVVTITVPKPRGGVEEIWVDDRRVTLEELEARLRAQREARGRTPAVEIEADREVAYETFVRVVAAVRRAGIESVGLPVEAKTVAPPNESAQPPPPAPAANVNRSEGAATPPAD